MKFTINPNVVFYEPEFIRFQFLLATDLQLRNLSLNEWMINQPCPLNRVRHDDKCRKLINTCHLLLCYDCCIYLYLKDRYPDILSSFNEAKEELLLIDNL